MSCNRVRSISLAEAMVVLAAYDFGRRRVAHREFITALTLQKITAMARVIGIHAKRTPCELGVRTGVGGVRWPTELLRQASSIVDQAKQCNELQWLRTCIEDLSVKDVEGYEEDPDRSGPTAPNESTGVYVIGRQVGEA